MVCRHHYRRYPVGRRSANAAIAHHRSGETPRGHQDQPRHCDSPHRDGSGRGYDRLGLALRTYARAGHWIRHYVLDGGRLPRGAERPRSAARVPARPNDRGRPFDVGYHRRSYAVVLL